MAYDPTWPPTGADLESAAFRAQFNGIADLVQAGVPGPQGIQGPPGNDGAPGPQGEQGPPGASISFPYAGPAIVQGPVYSENSSIAISTGDTNGSGETSVRLNAADAAAIPVFQVTGRQMGSDRYSIKLDLAGCGDGAGIPSAQDGAIYRFDAASQTIKPWNIIVRTVQVQDLDGNPMTVQIICPPP